MLSSAAMAANPEDTKRFAALLDRSEGRGLTRLAFGELRDLARLYRLHTSRLARLRTAGGDTEAIRYLNALCVRAYTYLFVSPRRRSLRVMLREEMPGALARTWNAQVVAWAILAAGILVGAALGWRDPGAVHALVPGSLGYSAADLDRLIASPAARADFLQRSSLSSGAHAFFSSVLFVNNTKVGLLSFATGMLAGVPTALLQLYNGMILGAFASIFARDALPLAFWAWFLPHAIPELTAITFCAAGGLLLGAAVAAPGRQTRGRALRQATNPALLLFVASVPLFLVAAGVESFVRESSLGLWPRFAVAAAMLAALLLGSMRLRRLARRRSVDRSWLGALTTADQRAAPGSG